MTWQPLKHLTCFTLYIEYTYYILFNKEEAEVFRGLIKQTSRKSRPSSAERAGETAFYINEDTMLEDYTEHAVADVRT